MEFLQLFKLPVQGDAGLEDLPLPALEGGEFLVGLLLDEQVLVLGRRWGILEMERGLGFGR